MSHRPHTQEEGTIAAAPETAPVGFDLVTALEDWIQTLGPSAHAAGLELVCRVAPEVPDRVVGGAPLLRALTLLMENALHVAGHGELVLTVSAADRDVPPSPFAPDWTPGAVWPLRAGEPAALRFAVRISSRSPGEREQRTQEEAASTLIAALGGHLTQQQEGRQGHVWFFHITLEPTYDPLLTRQEVECPLRGRSVLAADDNATMRAMLEDLLSSWGVQVQIAENGNDALAAIREARALSTPFEAVLLDARMPKGSGFEVAQQLAKNRGLCGPLVLLMPAPFRKGDEAYCRRLGVAARVTKPVRRSELRQALETVLGPRQDIATSEARSPSRLMPETVSRADL